MSDEGAELIGRLGPSGDWTTPVGPRNWPKPPHPRLARRGRSPEPLQIRPEAVLGVTFPAGRVPTESWAGSLRATHRRRAWPDGPAVDLHGAHGRRAPGRARPRRARRRPTSPPRSRRRPRSPGTSNRSRSTGAATSTAACTPRPTPTSSARRTSTSCSCRRRCRRRATRRCITASQPVRRHFRLRLGQEVRRLRRRGIPVVVFQPSARRPGRDGRQGDGHRAQRGRRARPRARPRCAASSTDATPTAWRCSPRDRPRAPPGSAWSDASSSSAPA